MEKNSLAQKIVTETAKINNLNQNRDTFKSSSQKLQKELDS